MLTRREEEMAKGKKWYARWKKPLFSTATVCSLRQVVCSFRNTHKIGTHPYLSWYIKARARSGKFPGGYCALLCDVLMFLNWPRLSLFPQKNYNSDLCWTLIREKLPINLKYILIERGCQWKQQRKSCLQ